MDSSLNDQTIPSQQVLQEYISESAALHRHLCPRQILGIRLGLYGLRILGLVDHYYQPRYLNERKHLLTIVETDGCGADGIAVATGCYVGRRTLRVLDFGKMAATLVNIQSGAAVRVIPQAGVRRTARELVPEARSRWNAYLKAYQLLPDENLMQIKKVGLTQSLAEILSKPSARAICDLCGEEIMNEREIVLGEQITCRGCAGETYFYEL